MIQLTDVLMPTQSQLFSMLHKTYQNRAIGRKGKFLLVRGDAPILLLAHLDTVHKEPVRVIRRKQGGNILTSPQGIGGDDRCGVYALVCSYERAKKKPWMLFTCDEEIGGIGAKAFADAYRKKQFPTELDEVKMLVEIDRRGSHDAVYYSCSNEDFESYITSKGFHTEYGSFSDISILAPAMGVAAVNLSSGYYNAHTTEEYINCKHLEAVMEKVAEIIEDAARDEVPRYEYIENEMHGYPWSYGYLPWKGYGLLSRRIPKALSGKYAEIYDFLLDYFDFDELEYYRKEYGNEMLLRLYVSVLKEL